MKVHPLTLRAAAAEAWALAKNRHRKDVEPGAQKAGCAGNEVRQNLVPWAMPVAIWASNQLASQDVNPGSQSNRESGCYPLIINGNMANCIKSTLVSFCDF
jgi:hypothetical protein